MNLDRYRPIISVNHFDAVNEVFETGQRLELFTPQVGSVLALIDDHEPDTATGVDQSPGQVKDRDVAAEDVAEIEQPDGDVDVGAAAGSIRSASGAIFCSNHSVTRTVGVGTAGGGRTAQPPRASRVPQRGSGYRTASEANEADLVPLQG